MRQSDFAPADRSDGGRKPGEWQSKYPEPAAQRNIWFEAGYLALLLFSIPIILLLFWLDYPQKWVGLSDQKYKTILKYGTAWLGGTLGGTLFDIKWLYHCIARQIWHLDRRLWRLMTPHISGGLAFVFIALISSGVLRIFDSQAMDSLSMVVGVSFLVGYFSDSAVAKLTEIADTIFGASRSNDKNNNDKNNNE